MSRYRYNVAPASVPTLRTSEPLTVRKSRDRYIAEAGGTVICDGFDAAEVEANAKHYLRTGNFPNANIVCPCTPNRAATTLLF